MTVYFKGDPQNFDNAFYPNKQLLNPDLPHPPKKGVETRVKGP